MTFDEYQQLPNKEWWQITDRGYWDAGAASRDAEIAELVEAAQMAIEMIETNAHERKHVRHKLKDAIAKVRKP